MLRGTRRLELHQLAEAENGVQRRAQLVAHARQELALRAAGRFGRFARGPQRGFRLATLGDVANDARRPDECAVMVARRTSMDFDPARRAGLRHIARFVTTVVRRAVDERRDSLASHTPGRPGARCSRLTMPSVSSTVNPVICVQAGLRNVQWPAASVRKITSSISLDDRAIAFFALAQRFRRRELGADPAIGDRRRRPST